MGGLMPYLISCQDAFPSWEKLGRVVALKGIKLEGDSCPQSSNRKLAPKLTCCALTTESSKERRDAPPGMVWSEKLAVHIGQVTIMDSSTCGQWQDCSEQAQRKQQQEAYNAQKAVEYKWETDNGYNHVRHFFRSSVINNYYTGQRYWNQYEQRYMEYTTPIDQLTFAEEPTPLETFEDETGKYLRGSDGWVLMYTTSNKRNTALKGTEPIIRESSR